MAKQGGARLGESGHGMAKQGLFTPKRDDGRAYWRVIFDRLATAPPGSVVSHEELTALLGDDDRGLLYASVSRAARELRKQHKRDIAALRGEGYRVLLANEHVAKAETHKDRAERQLKVANEVVDATDLAALTAIERELWSQVKRGMVLLYQAVSSHELTLARHEDLINALQNRVEELEGGGQRK